MGWVQHHLKKSITELEIVHGVLNTPAMHRHAFFLFRDPAFLADLPTDLRAGFEPESPEHKQKLDALKQVIRDSGLPFVENYPCRYTGLASRTGIVHLEGLEEFGRRIHDWLWASIQREYQLSSAPPPAVATVADALAEEQGFHERFMESRLRVYVGRQQLLQSLIDYAEASDEMPRHVTAPSGAGKSAALAKFVDTWTRKHPNALVISHFVGASPASTNLQSLLHRLCSTLKQEFAFIEDVPADTNGPITTFRQFIDKIPADRRVVLVLDALNQLDEADNAQRLSWLPWKFPGHVKLIASCIADPGREETVLQSFAHRPHKLIAVEPLTTEERQKVLKEMPSLSAKALDQTQVNLLLANPATENPLFLLVALEELCRFGSYEQLNQRIESFPRDGETVTDLFKQVIERLEAEFQPEAVRSLLTLLASARRGLSDRGLLDVTEEPNIATEQSTSDLFPVLRQIRSYLQHRGRLWDFFHRNLFKGGSRSLAGKRRNSKRRLRATSRVLQRPGLFHGVTGRTASVSQASPAYSSSGQRAQGG